MALESQGVNIRMADSTVATLSATDDITVEAADGIKSATSTDANSFITAGFATYGPTTYVRIRMESASNCNTAIYTIASGVTAVTATQIPLWETPTADTATGQKIYGYKMNAIGQVISFSGPSGAAAIIDVTNLGSTAKEKIIGIRDEGQFTLEVNYSATVSDLHAALNADRQARTKRFYEIELTDSTVAGSFLFFEAYVSGFSLSGAVDDVIKGSITLELANEMHWTKTTR